MHRTPKSQMSDIGYPNNKKMHSKNAENVAEQYSRDAGCVVATQAFGKVAAGCPDTLEAQAVMMSRE